MDQEQELTAKTVVNEWSYQDLIRIFFQYGEENFRNKLLVKSNVVAK